MSDLEFVIDSRHANLAREAAKILRGGVTHDEREAIHDTVHNHKRPAESDGIASDRLRSIVERIERLEEERKSLSSDIKDIFTEAKSAGFDVPVLRQLLKIRKADQDEVEQAETLLDTYRRALGM